MTCSGSVCFPPLWFRTSDRPLRHGREPCGGCSPSPGRRLLVGHGEDAVGFLEHPLVAFDSEYLATGVASGRGLVRTRGDYRVGTVSVCRRVGDGKVEVAAVRVLAVIDVDAMGLGRNPRGFRLGVRGGLWWLLHVYITLGGGFRLQDGSINPVWRKRCLWLAFRL